MPWRTEWVDPELFLEYKGVKVYRSYKDNDADQPLTFWYTTDPDRVTTPLNPVSEIDPYEFDVRDLVLPGRSAAGEVVEVLAPPRTEREEIAHKIRCAVDANLIEVPPFFAI